MLLWTSAHALHICIIMMMLCVCLAEIVWWGECEGVCIYVVMTVLRSCCMHNCYEAVCVGAAERECGMLDRLYAEVCAGRNGLDD